MFRSGAICTMTLAGLALAWPSAPPAVAQEPAACLDEASTHGRAACLGLAADEIIVGMQGTIMALTAEAAGARPAQLRAFERAVLRDQREWLAQMEQECRMAAELAARPEAAVARQSCRLAAADARAVRLADTIATARAANGLPPATADPDCAVLFDLRPGRPPPDLRRTARIECAPGRIPAPVRPGR